MRLVYTADLHGDLESFAALLDLAAATDAQAAIVGGDLLPHAIKLHGAVERQLSFINRALRPLLAAFHRQHPSIAVYLLAGNDDWAAAIAALDHLEQEECAHPLHARVYRLPAAKAASVRSPTEAAGADAQTNRAAGGLWLAGYACVPITPFSIKDYERRDAGPLPPFDMGMAYTSWGGAIEPLGAAELAARPSIADDLARLAQQSEPERTIYVCHTPPADTPLDQMPRGRHVGSRALRAFIEREQPPLTLHGHIHEAPDESGQYVARIGATWCVNPGHSAGRFQAVALDTSDIAGTIEHTVFGRLA